jgi:hypothetical protein
MAKSYKETESNDILSEMGLATKNDGAIVGVIFAILVLIGWIKLEVGIPQKMLIWLILLIGIIVAGYNIRKHKSLFSPPIDGFVQGFCLVYGFINLLLGKIT